MLLDTMLRQEMMPMIKKTILGQETMMMMMMMMIKKVLLMIQEMKKIIQR